MRFIASGRKDIGAAGTAEQLANDLPCTLVVLEAPSTNTGDMAVGVEPNTKIQGWPALLNGPVASPGASQEGSIIAAGAHREFPVDNINMLWLDAATTGEGVTFTVWV
jgi:hypothetical protein